ncbi:MAG: hypothetical protein ACTHOK_05025, partial [Nocardioidaceae bacterium]
GSLVLVVRVWAVVVSLVVGRRAGRGPAPTPRRRTPPPRTLGPDDDEDFLRGLNRRPRGPEGGPDQPANGG